MSCDKRSTTLEIFQGQFLDILGVNKYASWYEYPGELDTIVPKVVEQCEGWHKKYNKPVLVTEYGADTLEGYHVVRINIWFALYISKSI